MKRWGMLGAAVALIAEAGLAEPAPKVSAEVASAIETIHGIGPEGRGNRAAQSAWQTLSEQSAESLEPLLAGLDGASPLAANWIGSATEVVLARTLASGKPLPTRLLEAFVKETRHSPRGRRLAYEWLIRVDPAATDRLIPGMLNDPSVEFRRDAVSRLLDQAKQALDAKDTKKAGDLYEAALIAARDEDQIKTIVKPLGEMGRSVDLPKHFGMLTHWKLIGPFDNKGGIGFAKAYPPETDQSRPERYDPKASYPGVTGALTWIDYETADPYGLIDLNKALDKHKGAVAYAVTEFTAESDRDVEFRLGSITAWKIWLNGELLFAREEYHKGMYLDQYVVSGRLKRGRNVILLKNCQNEQTESWAQVWQFQLRVCDATGTAILSTTRPAATKKVESGGGM